MTTFAEYISMVNRLMVKHYGITINDIEDWQWNEYFDDDYSLDDCRAAASEAVADWSYDHNQPGDPALYQLEETV